MSDRRLPLPGDRVRTAVGAVAAAALLAACAGPDLAANSGSGPVPVPPVAARDACKGGVAPDRGNRGQAPHAFWVSQPVRPDETALIAAGNLDADASVDVAAVPDCDTSDGPLVGRMPRLEWSVVKPLHASASSIAFVVPGALPDGVFAYRIASHGRTSEVGLINRPDAWFIQGDRGDFATPGGWLQVHGTGLALPGGPTPILELVAAGARVARLSADPTDPAGDGYRQRFRVPASVPPGDYELYLHNGHGGDLGWSKFSSYVTGPVTSFAIRKAAAWPADVFDVADQSGTDAQARVEQALLAARRNGGGVVYLPPGSYDLRLPLKLPDRTTLRGAGRTRTTLRWSSAAAGALISNELTAGANGQSGTTFSIEDLAIEAGADFAGDAVSRTEAEEPGRITRVRITLPQGRRNDDSRAVYLRRTRNTSIDDCELDARRAVFARDRVSFLRITNTTLIWRDVSVWLSGESHNFVIENNRFVLRGTAESNGWLATDNPGFWYTSFFGADEFGGPYTRDLYFGHNESTTEEVERPPKYVGFTYDGSNGIYLGKVTRAHGTTLELAGRTLDPKAAPGYADWAGAIVQIIGGRGRGQWRYVAEARPGSDRIRIDRPWDLEPDADSIITIVNYLGRALVIGNDLAGDRLSQAYFVAQDAIYAHNRYPPDSANLIWAGRHYGGVTVAWHVQALENVIGQLVSFPYEAQSGYGTPAISYQVFRGNSSAPGVADGFVGLLAKPGAGAADSVIELNHAGPVRLRQPGYVANHEGIVVRDNPSAGRRSTSASE